MDQFFERMLTQFGNTPDDYVVFDAETTGPIVGTDLITQAGLCIVKNRQCVHRDVRVLNWADSDLINRDWLAERMAKTKEIMESKGKTYHTTFDLLRTGDDPRTVLRDYAEIFEDAREKGFYFVGHNVWNFDRKIFCHHWSRFTPEDPQFDWGENELFDTGMVAKAIQIGSYPWSNDTIKSWAARVGAVRAKGVFWALDNYCVPTYKLAEKHNLDMASAHDAGFDCYVTHLLFEEFRQMAEEGRCTTF